MKKILLLLVLAATLVTALAGNLFDASGTLSSGSSQVALAANTSVPLRQYLFFQNNGTHVMWINFGSAATASQPSIQIGIAGSVTSSFTMTNFVSDDSVNVIGTSGDTYTLKYK
jgi:hypothetical protein